jgi:hypothetical protein
MLRKIAVAGLCLATAHSAAVDQLQKRDGAHAHDHAEPAGYGAPPAAYEPPAAEYGAPAPAYEAPADSYGVSYGGYEEETLPDLTPIIVGILVLTGLSLLFPTFVSLTTVRRKRHAEDDVNPMTEVVGRVNDIYSAVVQSEECMERIACEVGGLAADVGLTQSPAIKLAGGFVPSKYKNYYKQFASGKDCQKIKCGTFA